MESKVLLFDENGVGMGETFNRRARQLVGRQRAEWTDESHSAIRFTPSAADTDGAEPERVTEHAAAHRPKGALYELAQRRLNERRKFMLHTLAFLAASSLLVAIIGSITYGFTDEVVVGILFGGNLTLFAVHAWSYARKRVTKLSLPRVEDYKARKLAAEVDKLKRMGYTD